MSENKPENPQPGHESRDVNVWAVGKFAIAMAVLCVLSLALLYGLFRYFLSETGGKPAPSVEEVKLPPSPTLQTSPAMDLKIMRAEEDQVLNNYGWVDQSKGVVRIPIARAIDVLAQRGLPARPQTAVAAASDVSVPTESGLGPKVHQPGGPLAGELK